MMFKSFKQDRRVSSVDFTHDQDLLNEVNKVAGGKENTPKMGPPNGPPPRATPLVSSRTNAEKAKEVKGKMSRGGPKMSEPAPEDTTQAFDRLLDDLQIPQTLRPKLNSMEASVKAAMIRSQHTLNLTINPVTGEKAKSDRATILRRTKSTDSFEPPTPSPDDESYEFPSPPRPYANSPKSRHKKSQSQSTGRVFGAALAMASSTSIHNFFSDANKTSTATKGVADGYVSEHSRGASMDTPRARSKSQTKSDFKGSKDKYATKDSSPSYYVNLFMGTSSLQLEVEVVKKLRLMLRNESASWTEGFFELGGYTALLTRLNEILEVEWREEQHDDQILHEFLRCFKALSTSAVGCEALRSASPAPFAQLVRLLFSDKKPGDVPSRQLIVELLLVLFELYPASEEASIAFVQQPNSRRREIWEIQMPPPTEYYSRPPSRERIILPSPHPTLFSFIRELLLTRPPPPAEGPASPVTPHEFIESLHVPRIYKTYLQELSDVCRDYFWVFCHPGNTVWNLPDVDDAKVEKPRAPGGMTGGVEFEAMGYLTTHFKFINALSRCAADLNLPKDHEHSAYRLHADMFASGMERIILVARKASTTYYPTLHLEIARYVALVAQSGLELPWNLSRAVGSPPSALCKPGSRAKEIARERDRSRASQTPPRRSTQGIPKIPTPQKADPIRL